MTDESPRRFDPNQEQNIDIDRILNRGARFIELVFAGLLCLAGLLLSLEVFFTVSGLVSEPDRLEPILASWEREVVTAGGSNRVPATTNTLPNQEPSEDVLPFQRFLTGIVTEFSSGSLARPLGGIIILFYIWVLVKIPLVLLSEGVKMLSASPRRKR